MTPRHYATRTSGSPCDRSPSRRDHAALPVLLGTVAIVVIAAVLPLSPLAAVLKMTALPVVYLVGNVWVGESFE
jgi:hypothetical protein